MMDKLRIFRNPWERLSFHSPPSLPPSLPWASARRHTPITPPSTQRQRKGQAFGEDSGPGRLSNYHLVHVPLMFYVGGSLSVGSFQGGGYGRGQGRSGCLFPSALTEKLRSRMEALFSAAAAELKVAQSEHGGSSGFPVSMYPAVAQRPCWVTSATAVRKNKNIFLLQIILGAPNAIILILKTYLYIISAPYCTPVMVTLFLLSLERYCGKILRAE